MIRIEPSSKYDNIPCSVVACGCALDKSGYHYFKRGERHTLSSFDFTDKKAIVIVYGHCIYVQGDEYYSFFNNENDLVVAIWEIEKEK